MTQTAKHTPGPWKNILASSHAGILLETETGFVPATEGDILRMLAAPDMAEACQAALKDLEAYGLADGVPDDPQYALAQQLRAALKKAGVA